MCFLTTTFRNAPAHPPPPPVLIDQSLKLQDVNVLENSRFFAQNLYLTWLYVVVNGDSENVLFFVIISNLCLVPVLLQRIYVVN